MRKILLVTITILITAIYSYGAETKETAIFASENGISATWKRTSENEYFCYMKRDMYKGNFTGYRCVRGEKTGSRCEAHIDLDDEYGQYVYTIRDDKGQMTDPEIITYPDMNRKKVSFMYVGDIQYEIRKRDYDRWNRFIGEALKSYKPGIIVTGGDMVDSCDSIKDWSVLLSHEQSVFKKIPFLTAAGNHETDGTFPLYLDMVSLPDNGPLGLEEEFCSLDYGPCHITVLNSSFLLKERKKKKSEEEAVAMWLEEDLKKAGTRWKIVVMHHPPYGINDRNKVYKRIKEMWLPVMEKYGVVLCFNGHQHVYMRTEEIRGITYIQGNSGAKRCSYYDSANIPSYVEYVNEYDSTVQMVYADNSRIKVVSYNEDGEKTDSWEYGEEKGETVFKRLILWVKKVLNL